MRQAGSMAPNHGSRRAGSYQVAPSHSRLSVLHLAAPVKRTGSFRSRRNGGKFDTIDGVHRPVVVVDTNVFVSACLGSGPANQVVRMALTGQCRPLMGAALFSEYQDLLGREPLWLASPLTRAEREELFEVFLATCQWTRVYFAWRPNLADEGDNHLIELAVAGGASVIVSRNLRDLMRGQLQFPQLQVMDPAGFLKEFYP